LWSERESVLKQRPSPAWVTRRYGDPQEARFRKNRKQPNRKGVDIGRSSDRQQDRNPVSPNATAAVLTALLATPVENLTVAQLQLLENVICKIPGGHAPGITISSLLR
jgi:hypothetical protein